MTANDTAHKLDSAKRQRMEQIEGFLRRLNPELTDEQLEELMVEFRQRSVFTDGGIDGSYSSSLPRRCHETAL